MSASYTKVAVCSEHERGNKTAAVALSVFFISLSDSFVLHRRLKMD